MYPLKSAQYSAKGKVAALPGCLALLVILVGGQLYAQSRSSVGISTVGKIGSQAGFGVSTFRNNSYGNPSKSSSSSSSSSKSGGSAGGANYSISRKSSGSGSGAGAGSSFTGGVSSGRAYNSVNTTYTVSKARISNSRTGRDLVDPLVTGQIALGTSMAVTFGLGDSLLVPGRRLRSFAPSNAGRYATLVRAGEQDILRRQYLKAVDVYRQVRYIDDNLPETHLGIAHANFVLNRYNSMSLNIADAIELEPDLFRCDIALRSFFSDPSEFIRLRDQLAAYCKGSPADAGAHLSLCYVLWFDGDRAGAGEALKLAAKFSKSPRLTQAAESIQSILTPAPPASPATTPTTPATPVVSSPQSSIATSQTDISAGAEKLP